MLPFLFKNLQESSTPLLKNSRHACTFKLFCTFAIPYENKLVAKLLQGPIAQLVRAPDS